MLRRQSGGFRQVDALGGSFGSHSRLRGCRTGLGRCGPRPCLRSASAGCVLAVASWLVRLAGISLCGAHCLLTGLLAGHRLRPLHPHRACRDAYTPTSPALGAGRGGDREEAVDVDSNASFAGEVERYVSRDNYFWRVASFLKRRSLSSASRLSRASESKGQRRRVATDIGAIALRSSPDDVRPIAYCRASLQARRRGVTAVSVRRRFTASSFRFWVSATSGRLGQGNGSSAVEGRPAVLSRWTAPPVRSEEHTSEL